MSTKIGEFYCSSDGKYHYKSELPKPLKEFVDYTFSSGPITGADFKSFNTKFKNVIKKQLPVGYEIYSWSCGHYDSSGVIKDNQGRYIYISISDVRYFNNNWIDDILIRTMNGPKDWTGGTNRSTSLFTFMEDIQKLYR